VIERVLLLRQILSSTVDGRSLLAEITVAGGKTMDSDANETGSVQFSQYFFLGWMHYEVNKW